MFLAGDTGRLFGLDMQLLFGMMFQMISILILFVALTYILYDPVRKILEERRVRIWNEMTAAKKERVEAEEYRKEYEFLMKNAHNEAEEILKKARITAGERTREILQEANEEKAERLMQGRKELELEEIKMRDDIKSQILEVGSLMAEKLVRVSLDEEERNRLFQEMLEELGDISWLEM